MATNIEFTLPLQTPGIFESKDKKTSSRDLIAPEKNQPKKEEVKKIGSGKNDIIERADQKIVIEDGRQLL